MADHGLTRQSRPHAAAMPHAGKAKRANTHVSRQQRMGQRERRRAVQRQAQAQDRDPGAVHAEVQPALHGQPETCARAINKTDSAGRILVGCDGDPAGSDPGKAPWWSLRGRLAAGG